MSGPPSMRRPVFALLIWLCCQTSTAVAQDTSSQSGSSKTTPSDPPFTTAVTVTVVGTTPLGGVDLPVDQIAAPVQTATASDLDHSGALDLAGFLNGRINGIHVNEVQGNPFQPDVSYRGYTASPLLGTPQGLSVFMDGVRLNQPFGEVVSWDLIPTMAIRSTALMPGSNPLFGLNTLGGALSIQTKDGRSNPGTTAILTYGSDNRRSVEFEHGGTRRSGGLDWYVAGQVFAEDGWRDDSPSGVRQLFGKLAWRRPLGDLVLSVVHANNSLSGNGLQEEGFLERRYAGLYTRPDHTDNRSTLLTLSTTQVLTDRVALSANAYYRDIHTRTLNGDLNEGSLDQDVYQLTPAERAALLAAGYVDLPAGGNADTMPFPSLRCIANVTLREEPASTCNGLLNRTTSTQRNGGASAQITRLDAFGPARNRITTGAAFDRSGVDFLQSTELGYLNPDRSITGTNAFADGVTGGVVDGHPFDTRVDLHGTIHTWSVYATDTWSPRPAWHVTVSGRFNRTVVDNADRITPGGGPGSLDGRHIFSRFNPAAGVTFNPSSSVNVYAGYSEGSRAATSIELGCADPEQPCKLPNAMAGDPELEQVVTRTWEIGVRDRWRGADWHAGYFRANNADDILFVTSEQTGFGYFRNFGSTRRQGLEASVQIRAARATFGVGYTLLAATFQSAETVNGAGNASNDRALDGKPGVEGTIEIDPGDRMPLTPRHMGKVFADLQLTRDLSVDVALTAISSSYARGNENNAHEPDGTYYLGPGTSPGYAVVNLGARYRLVGWLQLLGQIDNLLDRRYYTAAQLGPVGFDAQEHFIARPFPESEGDYPVRHSTFFAPGAPRRAWVGTRVNF